MSEKYKADDDHPYFVTITLQGWIDLFTRSEFADIIIDSLRYCHLNKGLIVHEFVIMSSHVHLIIQNEAAELSAIIRDFKKFTAKTIIGKLENHESESRKEWILRLFRYYAKFKRQNKTYSIWRKSNRPIVLDNAERYTRCVHYIHQNPVKAGLVVDAHHWFYSSAFDENPLANVLGKTRSE